MKILVTGAAGFIGMHTAQRLLEQGHAVTGLDNFNEYYDVRLKHARIARLARHGEFEAVHGDICDSILLDRLFDSHRFDRVIHLAAQAGVRYSLDNPRAYVESNVAGFLNVLEGCRRCATPHLVYASTSSVYGGNTSLPFRESDSAAHPVSLYAATKRANELMAHSYSHLFGVPTTGLRFFTVYGPWGRPDMSPMLFASAILEGRAIDVFNHGNSERDFTYVDDVVEGVVRVMERIPAPDPAFDRARPDPSRSWAPYRIYNIGNHDAVPLMRFIEVLEQAIGRRAQTRLLPMQPGDVAATYADVDALARDAGFKPATPLEEGLRRFVDWYRQWRDEAPQR